MKKCKKCGGTEFTILSLGGEGVHNAIEGYYMHCVNCGENNHFRGKATLEYARDLRPDEWEHKSRYNNYVYTIHPETEG